MRASTRMRSGSSQDRQRLRQMKNSQHQPLHFVINLQLIQIHP
jgi:hypothetical protein